MRASANCWTPAWHLHGRSTSPWATLGHAAFAAVQTLAMAGHVRASLCFDPDAPLTAADWREWGGKALPRATRAQGAMALFDLAPPG